MRIAFIGLGRMGFPMAGHLVSGGYDVTVFNRSVEKSQLWSEKYKGTYVHNLADLPDDLDIIISCLKDDKSISDILTNNYLVNTIRYGGLIIDHSTTSLELVQKMNMDYQTKKRHNYFQD